MNGVKNVLLTQLQLSVPMRDLSALVMLLCCSTNVFASCEYSINSEWSTGFTGSIKITNSGSSSINGWTVAWQYGANKITSSWNATVTGNNPYSATGLNWNSSIQPGQSVSFGFQGDKNSSLAEKPVITGSVCDSVVLSSSSVASSSLASSNSSIALSSSSVAISSSSKSSASSSLSSISSAKNSLRSSSISSSVISSAISSNKSTSSSSIATNQQCNWYGTLYPLCETTATGWGYENNKSCIAAVTCSAQPAPYGIVGASSSSSLKSSSSSLVSNTASSSKSSAASSSKSSAASSSKNSSVNSASSVKNSSSSLSSSSSKTSSSSSSVSSVSVGILFQENFESGAINTQPAGWDNFIAWNYNTTNSNTNSTYAVIESGKAYSGTKAIHFKGSLAQIVHKLPAGIQRLHMRAYVNLSKKLGNDSTDNHEHIMGIKKTQDANDEIRVGQIKGVLGTNHVPSDNIAPKMDKWYGGTELSPNIWYCVETAMYADTAYDELYMWVDGNLVHSITSANDWNNGPLSADWLSDKFNYVMFGFHSFSGNTADVWMDDIVVSTQPIGCAIN